MDRSVLEKKALAELKEIASALDLSGYTRMKKADLVDLIAGVADEDAADDGKGTSGSDDGGDGSGRNGRERSRTTDADRSDRNGSGGRDRHRRRGRGDDRDDLADAEVREGVLDLLPEGYGFLRTTGYLSGAKDVYVSQSYVRRFHLRRGDRVRGPIRSNNRGNDKFPALARVDAVEGRPLDDHLDLARPEFDQLTPLSPDERLRLETGEDSPTSMRIVDLLAPIGKGQRGMIASPPRAGRTTILEQLAHAIETNEPDAELMVLLVDERPEEVTDFERATGGEVIASTFDQPADDHAQIAELVLERAKRLVERGRDVVVLLDSLTALARAHNLATSTSGRVLSGGMDSAALYPPKRFFGAARNVEEGGSLTIIATVLVETGSRTDEVILEEFGGTDNMQLRLDHQTEQQRIFPVIDVQQSGTRREELLRDESDLETVRELRRALSQMEPGPALELLLEKLQSTPSNEQFLQTLDPSDLGG